MVAPLFAERVAFPKESRTWQQFFICFRRVAAGLDESVQTAMRDELDPFVAPSEARLKKPKGPKPEASEYALREDPALPGSWQLKRLRDGQVQTVASGDVVDGMRIDFGAPPRSPAIASCCSP